MEYIQRLNHFAATRTWDLDPTGINWRDDNGESGRIAYGAISNVRLRFEPSRAERRRFVMRFQANREYIISNINYRGVANFVDQSGQFRNFVTAFHDNLQRVNPDVSYQSGSTKGAYLGNWVLTLFVLAMLFAAGLFFISIGMVWIAALKLVIIVFYLPTLFRSLVINRPGTYRPNNIPVDILPA